MPVQPGQPILTVNHAIHPSTNQSMKQSANPLNSDAPRRAALEEIKNLFRSPDHLTRLPVYIAEYERKRTDIKQSINQSIESHVNDTRRGLSLLVQSSQSINQVRTNLSSIDQFCNEVRSMLGDVPLIRQLNTGRKNLEATHKLMDKFRSLPDQCEDLLDEMYDNERAIKHVYLSLRKLMQLRDTAFDPSIAQSFSAEFTAQLNESFERLQDTADEMELRIWENITDCNLLARDDPTVLVRTLQVIEMEDKATRKVLTVLVRTLQVIEMEDKATRKVFTNNQSNSQSSTQPKPRIMRERCLLTLEKSIADSFESLHKDEATVKKEQRMKEKLEKIKAKEQEKLAKQKAKAAKKVTDDEDDEQNPFKDDEQDDESDEDSELDMMALDTEEMVHQQVDAALSSMPDGDAKLSSYAIEVLEHMQDLVDRLDEVTPELAPCFPPDYEIIEFFENRYKHWIKVTINFHTNDVSKLSKRALLKCVSWMSIYMSRMRELHLLPSVDERQWDNLISDMMLQYTAATEMTLTALIDNILRVEEQNEPEADPQGHYHTTGPADLFFTINQQMDIVLNQYSFDSKPLGYVCFMLADIFTYYQNGQLRFLGEVELDPASQELRLGPQGMVKHDTFFTAVINNCELCRENMDELKDKCLDKIRQAKTLPVPLNRTLANNQSSNQSVKQSAFETMLSSFQSTPALVSKLEDVFDECGEGFISVASEAVDCLVLGIMAALAEPIANLFTDQWRQDRTLINDLTATLGDFFTDYLSWLTHEAYFARIVRLVLHQVSVEYLRRFLSSKPALNDAFFSSMKQDQIALDEFFMQYKEYVSESVIAQELSSIQTVQSLLQGDPEALAIHFDKVIDTWKERGHEVIDTVMSLRKDCDRATRKQLSEEFAAHSAARQARDAQKLNRSAIASTMTRDNLLISPAGGATTSGPASINQTIQSTNPPSTRSRRSGSNLSFVNPQSSFLSMFASRPKPQLHTKPSQRQGRYRQEGEATMDLNDFLNNE